ncbi:MAG: helix-turn-helix domain-containing protein [Acidobacteriota bacterium]|nr:helix-turn-helix domain-containing protein [Acidobacteriota bacterium]
MRSEAKVENGSVPATEARLLTVQEAARYMAVSVSTLYGWVWQRRIPFVKMGRALRFDLDDLKKFIETSRVKSNSAGFSAK